MTPLIEIRDLRIRFHGDDGRITHAVDSVDLTALNTLLSTGSPLLPEGFEFVYRAIKPDLHLASISGGRPSTR